MASFPERGSHRTLLRIDKWDEEQTEWVQRRSGLVEPDRKSVV